MANYIVGSARHDENGNLRGGRSGDQTGHEVETQSYYYHSKGWYILRLKDEAKAEALGNAMQSACNNNNIGYNQAKRLEVITYGIKTNTKCNCDCSSLVRACLNHVGINVGNFTTANEVTVLMNTGLFTKEEVKKGVTPVLYKGDILVTKKQGHTVIVTSSDIGRATRKYAIAIPTLKKGNKGHNVSLLQANLIEICGQNIARDSIFGAQTEAAVINVQKLAWPKDRSQWDGIYGKKTAEVMKFFAALKGYEVY